MRKLTPSLALFLVIVASYLLAGRYIPSGDAMPAELIPISIIEGQGFKLNNYVDTKNELHYSFKNVNRTIVSSYPVVPGLFNLPTYYFAYTLGFDIKSTKYRYILSHITAATLTALSAVMLFLLLNHLVSFKISLCFTIIYSFGTSVFSVASQTLWQHSSSLMLLNLIFLILLTKRSQISFIIAGIAAGLTFWTRPTNICFLLPIFIYLLRYERKNVPYYLIGSLTSAIPMLLYGHFYLGSIFAFKDTGIYGVSGFSGNPFEGFLGLLFSPSRGLMIYTPIFLFSLLSIPHLIKREIHPLIWTYLIGALCLLLLNSKWFSWWGGHTFGYRLLIESVPVMVIILALCVHFNTWGSKAKFIFYSLLPVSFYFQLLGVAVYPCNFNKKLDQNPAVLWSMSDSQPVLCSKKLYRKFRKISSGSAHKN